MMDRAEAIKQIELFLDMEKLGGAIEIALKMAITALREQVSLENGKQVSEKNQASEWVSVKDVLPGTERVLITNGEFVKEGYRRPDGVWKYGKEEHMIWERLSCHPVTHWMALPEPPKD